MNCKICQKPIEKVLELKQGRYFCCALCDFVFRDPQSLIDISAEKARYDLHQNSIEDEGYVAMFENFIDFAVEPYSVQEILDYGSGPDQVLAQLLRGRGYKVDCYDPLYFETDMKNHYDMIVSTEVFEHFYDPLKEMEKIVSLLKPGGYLAIMTQFLPELDKFKDWHYKNDATHVCFYSMRAFEFIAKSFGLVMVASNDRNTVLLQAN